MHLITGGELYAFTDAFGIFAMIAVDLTRAYEKRIRGQMFTDFKQIFGVITRGKRPFERRPAIDLTVARET